MAFLQLHQAAQRAQIAVPEIDEIGVFLKGFKTILPDRLLQFADRQGIQQVILAIDSLMIVASYREFGLRLGQRTKGVFVF